MRLGLLGKTALALVAVGLVPLGIVPYLVGLNREAMADQVLRLHAVAARSAAARVEAFLEPLRAAADGAAQSSLLATNPRGPAALELLQSLVQSQPRIAALAVVNQAGEEVVRVQARTTAEVAKQVLEDPSHAPLTQGRLAGRLWFRLTAPFPGGGGEVRLVADASSLQLVTRPEELGEEAWLVVASPESGIVASSSPELKLEALPQPLVAAARSGQISGSGRYPGPDGREVLGAYAPVDGSDWFVISAQPAQVAEAVARRMRERSLLAVAAAVVLAATAVGFAYRTVVRPLRDVVRAQRQLTHDVGPRAGAEIDQLRASFSLLEQQMKDREAVGQVFLGRYQVLEAIGSGGMGTVFKGFDPKLRRHVALKTVRLSRSPAGATSGARVTSLLQEAITTARFSHPNIVQVFDVEDAGDAAFVAMEYVNGRSLERYLSESGSLPPDQAVPLVACIARGLGAAHAQGIVHRDMKPGNVLLGRDGSVKITDFGIAEALSRVAEQADMIYGTPGYLAPESLLGRGQTPLGDLFSLGVIMYECLSGSPPFEGRSPEEIMSATLEATPQRLRERSAELPEEIEALVDGLIRKDPGKRQPASATEIAARLERLAYARGWEWSPAIPEREAFDELPSKTYSMMLQRRARAGAEEIS